MALVDAKYKFLFIDVGRNGRMNDGVIFRDSELAQHLNNNSLNLPEPLIHYLEILYQCPL